ncbi:hypothetical protein LguiA_026897 [Lonicera macranthoides]
MYLPTLLYSFLLKKNRESCEPEEALHSDILPFLIVPCNLQWGVLFQRHANKIAPKIHRHLIFQLHEVYELHEPLAPTCSELL